MTSLILVFYLFKLKRLRSKKWSIFLVYPITAIGFSLYYMYVKIYEFYLGRSNFDLLNLFLLIEPLAYGIYFIIIYLKLRRNNKVAISSEITIKGSDGDVSFIDDESGSIWFLYFNILQYSNQHKCMLVKYHHSYRISCIFIIFPQITSKSFFALSKKVNSPDLTVV